jgi:hypothetical protein
MCLTRRIAGEGKKAFRSRVGDGEALTQPEDAEVRASRELTRGAASTCQHKYKGYKNKTARG